MTLVGIGVVLLVKRRAASIRPVPPPPMALASPFVEYELFGPAVDEWVAHAPYPDQALRAMHRQHHSTPTPIRHLARPTLIAKTSSRSNVARIRQNRKCKTTSRSRPSLHRRQITRSDSPQPRQTPPTISRMPLPGRPKDFHRPATRITDRWFRARDGRRLERTPQARSARQDRTIGLAQRQGQSHRLSLAGHRVRWHARDHRAIHLGTHRLSQHTADCSRR